jgi:hypothetical protein
MENSKKIFLVLAILGVLVFLNAQPVSAQDNSALIAQLQQEIQSLIKQIIALMQQRIKLQNNNSQTATLTVNVSGVTAYISINGGTQFAYTSPLILNNGDTYLVTASSSNNGTSTSKCSGIASSGSSYVCNISISNRSSH